jgi:hypothetical protein
MPTQPRHGPDRAITQDRFVRLVRLVRLLAEGRHGRRELIRRLGGDERGFYRDLTVLVQAGVKVRAPRNKWSADLYALEGEAEVAIEGLPFPDPHLTLGEVRRLLRGHPILRDRLARLVGGVADLS